LTEDEIRTLWKALDALEPHMAAAFKLRLITAQRGGEVADMRWQDVDLAGGWWTIPAERSKNGLPHRVPLTPMAVAIIKALKTDAPTGVTGKDGKALRARVWEVADNGNARKAPVYILAGARGKRQGSRISSGTTYGVRRRP
jgi:integrase